MLKRYLTEDEDFLHTYPRLYYRIRAVNLRLRSYCMEKYAVCLKEDDGKFPRITAISFESEDAEREERFAKEPSPAKKKNRAADYGVTLDIDYGNGYVQTRAFSFGEEEERRMDEEVFEKSLYLFRSLYGIRRSKPNS